MVEGARRRERARLGEGIDVGSVQSWTLEQCYGTSKIPWGDAGLLRTAPLDRRAVGEPMEEGGPAWKGEGWRNEQTWGSNRPGKV